MRTGLLGIALAGAASLALTGAAHAQSTKGTGKVSISIIKWDAALPDPDGAGPQGPGGVDNVMQKAAGTFAAKPKASIVGLAPTGGTITSLKLAKDLGALDPTGLKPGFAPGDYVLELETGATPDGDALIKTYATLTIDSLNKCTVHVNPSVDPVTGVAGGFCQTTAGGPLPLCAGELPGKCTFTTYQIAGANTGTLGCGGVPTYACGVRDGFPNATRVRIRKRVLADDCQTGYVILNGIPIPPTPATANCTGGAVVGVGGVGAGDVDP